MKQAYGIVFCGPPGQFGIWTAAPEGLLMDREHVELLGQLAARCGASDYRVFELDSKQRVEAIKRSCAVNGQATFLAADQIGNLERILEASRGVPH
jgi:hypothetical protein